MTSYPNKKVIRNQSQIKGSWRVILRFDLLEIDGNLLKIIFSSWRPLHYGAC